MRTSTKHGSQEGFLQRLCQLSSSVLLNVEISEELDPAAILQAEQNSFDDSLLNFTANYSDDDDSVVFSSCWASLADCSGSQRLLFGGWKEPPSRLHPDKVDTEAALMQALAEREEDDRLDDGAVEINSDDEFTG